MNPAFKNIYMVSFLETVPQQLFKRQGIRKFFDPFRILMKRSGICCRKVGKVSRQIGTNANSAKGQKLWLQLEQSERNHDEQQ